VPRQQGQDIDRPLSLLPLPVNGSGQPLLSPEMIQKTRKHTPASPSLVASDEMSPLESADRHTAPSQKLLTSKQLTPHAAPALAPSLSSVLITHSPQPLNLFPQKLLDRTQTGDSNLVNITTIDSSYKQKAPIDGVGEEAVLEGQNMPLDMDSFRSRSCISRSGRYAPQLAALGIQWFRPNSSLCIGWSPPVEDNGILHTGSGQPLLSQESTSSFTV